MFYDQLADRLNIIDFDDAMYHWYVMDIERALDNIMSETSCENHSMLRENFIIGYRQEFNVSLRNAAVRAYANKICNLYGYTRDSSII